MKFFRDGTEGSETIVYRTFRGYWVAPDKDAGFGMQLPSDLTALDEGADQHSTQWQLWRSRATNTMYALAYNPHPNQLDWSGFRLQAKSSDKARLELAELLDDES